jgi:hypothetical protein
MHAAITTTPWPSVPFGTWRVWDSGVTWADIEKEKGKKDFSKLDKMVALAQEHGVEIMLPIGTPPPWASARPEEEPAFRKGSAAEPRNMEDWRDYVTALATRYKGKIRLWELWNEPNIKVFYSGSVEQMVELQRIAYEILKKTDPDNRLSTPSPTNINGVAWLRQFLAAGGGRYADCIGFHFYVTPKPPEAVVGIAQQVEAAMRDTGMAGRTIWNTETGWYIHSDTHEVKPTSVFNVISADEAEAYVPRTYILNWVMGVTRLNWYDWDSAVMALTEDGGKSLKPAGVAYGTTYNWLVGAVMKTCDSDRSDTWVCTITRAGGYNGYIVWNARGNTNFSIPGAWNIQNARELNGTSKSVRGQNKLAIGIKPILFENKTP